jgi:hypothetical protein
MMSEKTIEIKTVKIEIEVSQCVNAPRLSEETDPNQTPDIPPMSPRIIASNKN